MPKEKVALCSPPTATSHVIERLPRRFSRTDTAKSGTWRAYLEQVYGARSAGGAALTDLRSFTWFYHGSPLGTVEPARLGPRCEPLRGHAWVGPTPVRWPESQPALVRTKLTDRNEYKRRQAAVGPRVSRRAFGKDRRYPITNGWRPGD